MATSERITGTEAPTSAPQPTSRDLPAALEPELRRIIDTAVARVAAIELEAIKEARQITQRSEVEAREALRFALDRAFNLIHSLELMAATVNGMAEALKTELDDAIKALRNVPEPESALSKELADQPEPVVEQPAPVAEPEEPVVEESAPEPAAAEPAPEPQPQPEQPSEPRVKLTPIVRAADAGTPQTSPEQPANEPEAEEQAADEPAEEPELAAVGAGPSDAAPDAPSRKRRKRRFFSRR